MKLKQCPKCPKCGGLLRETANKILMKVYPLTCSNCEEEFTLKELNKCGCVN